MSTATADGRGGLAGTARSADPEAEIVGDIVRRVLPVTPVVLVVAAVAAGTDGALSAAVGLALVVVNFIAAAASLAWAARISYGLLMGVALFGYLIRISALFAAVFVLREVAWIHVASLGVTMVIAHLGLLMWELRYVSATLAHPALKPARPRPHIKEPEA